jgi:hypothetical protein
MINIAGEALLKPDFQNLPSRQPIWAQKVPFQRAIHQDSITLTRFAGGDKPLNAQKRKNPSVINKLFGDPAKNLTWALGYSVGGILLLPMAPVATSAFCLAGVHLLSATYQFLTRKTDNVSPAPNASQSARTIVNQPIKKPLSVLA